MSPTVLRVGGYRFFFFSREEPRVHVHVICGDGEAKYWLKPGIELASSYRLSRKQLSDIERIVEEHHEELVCAWDVHFGG